MQKLNLLKNAIETHFSNEAKIGDKFVKIHRNEFYHEDLKFLYNLSELQSVSVMIKRSGKGVTAILSVK